MSLTNVEKLQEAFSLALEHRSKGYADLVSNSNAILYLIKKHGMREPFSGPTIRERLLYNESGSYTRYTGYQFLNPTPAELFNDAEFIPKQAAVSITLSMRDILQNSGRAQLKNIFKAHLDAGEQELEDRFVEDFHSDGLAAEQIGGLQMMIPTTPNTGVYGGISRADHPIWRTRAFNVASDFTGIGTSVTSTTVKRIYDQIMIQLSRGQKGPGLIAAATEHYTAFSDALQAIQRVNDENGLGKLGFTSLRYYGAGKSVDVALEGGIGTAMPGNTTYFLDTKALRLRYHPERDFKPFGGKQTPINQDAIVQHVGFFGNATLSSPVHSGKLY